MIPVRLRLRNFLCYLEPECPLDFTGFRLACLAGDNGHGKSALLDAITWALWGEARAKRDDDLIHQGKSEMEVEFEFDLTGRRYRVLRKRSSKGSGQSQLEFQAQTEAGYRALTAESMRATQKTINDVLRMDYETFVNSAFLMQGRADEFTVKPPGERKRILAGILGLSYYDRLEERAKEDAKAVQSAIDDLAGQIREMERELTRRPEYEAEIQALQVQVRQAEERRSCATRDAESARRAVQALVSQREELDRVTRRIAQADASVQQLRAQLSEVSRRVTAYEEVLAQRAEVEGEYARLLEAREAERAMSGKVPVVVRLSQEKSRLDSEIGQARHALEVQLRRAQTDLAASAAVAATGPGWRSEAEAAAKELGALAAQEAAREEKRRAVQRAETEKAGLAAENSRLRQGMTDLREKLDLLQQAEAVCPLCQSPLSDADRDRVAQDLRKEGVACKEQFRSNEERIRGQDAEAATLKEEIAALDKALATRPRVQQREANAVLRQKEAETASEQVERLRADVAAVVTVLHEQRYAVEQQTRLSVVNLELERVGYDSGEHDRLRQQVQALSGYDRLYVELQAAVAQIDSERANRERLEQILEQTRTAGVEDRERQQLLTAQVRQLPRAQTQLAKADQALATEAARERDLRDQLAAARQKWDHCDYLERERSRKQGESRALTEEKSLLEQLRVAFSKRGIQAMIIESVIPELQDEANHLLSHMTDGRMQVAFDTQRETKRGDTVETLDIHIADELGTRPYELYSGGERFRVDFCIRVALSKLLARRAGANLQTLVIDEGFGSQDTSGRKRLVEAIQSVQDDFEKVLVITHVEELRDAFPVRINVVKGEDGSQYTIE